MYKIKVIKEKLGNNYKIIKSQPVNTLQLFITSNCNIRCKGCFFENYLSKDKNKIIYYNDYKKIIDQYKDQFEKVILIGGEPTLHPDLKKMIAYNYSQNLKTTVYTNGYKLKNILYDTDCKVRIGFNSFSKGTKPFIKLNLLSMRHFIEQITIVFMLEKSNLEDLEKVMKWSEDYGIKNFMISSMVDIQTTNDYWKIGDWCLSHEEYFDFVIKTLNNYKGNMNIHFCSRGMFSVDKKCNSCRYLNILPNGEKIICPFDISIGKSEQFNGFNSRNCGKHSQCLLQKIILKRIPKC